jgi:hypothetical protein
LVEHATENRGVGSSTLPLAIDGFVSLRMKHQVGKQRTFTDLYLRTVEAAVANPGQWIEVPRRFGTEMNAAVTAHCLRGGYLRVKPREDQPSITVNGKTYLGTATPVEVKIDRAGAEWKLRLRVVP